MTLELTHTALDRAAHDLDVAAEQLRATRCAAHRRVSACLGSQWTGGAADAFAQAWDDWQRGAEGVLTALAGHRRLLVATHRDLAETDGAADDRLRAVAGRLLDRLG